MTHNGVTLPFYPPFGKGFVDSGKGRLIVDAQGLTLPNWSLTWTVVDPIVVALPLSILTAVVVALVTKPMAQAYVSYVFGGAKPKV